jgi:hypothetical protein
MFRHTLSLLVAWRTKAKKTGILALISLFGKLARFEEAVD